MLQNPCQEEVSVAKKKVMEEIEAKRKGVSAIGEDAA